MSEEFVTVLYMDFLQIKDEVLIPRDGQIMARYTVHLFFWISFPMRNGGIDPRVVICNIYCYIIQYHMCCMVKTLLRGHGEGSALFAPCFLPVENLAFPMVWFPFTPLPPMWSKQSFDSLSSWLKIRLLNFFLLKSRCNTSFISVFQM